MSFTFAALDIGITDIEKKSMLEEVLALSSDVHHWNQFRKIFR